MALLQPPSLCQNRAIGRPDSLILTFMAHPPQKLINLRPRLDKD